MTAHSSTLATMVLAPKEGEILCADHALACRCIRNPHGGAVVVGRGRHGYFQLIRGVQGGLTLNAGRRERYDAWEGLGTITSRRRKFLGQCGTGLLPAVVVLVVVLLVAVLVVLVI